MLQVFLLDTIYITADISYLILQDGHFRIEVSGHSLHVLETEPCILYAGYEIGDCIHCCSNDCFILATTRNQHSFHCLREGIDSFR